jgi:hypothetical protein
MSVYSTTLGIVPTYTPSTFFWSNPAHNVDHLTFATDCPAKMDTDASACQDGNNLATCYNYELCKNYLTSQSILGRSGSDGRYQDLHIKTWVAYVQLLNASIGVIGMSIAIHYLRK